MSHRDLRIKDQCCLNKLIHKIQSLIKEDGSWSIPAEELLSILSMSLSDYYSFTYRLQTKDHALYVTHCYDSDHCDALISFLHEWGYVNALDTFYKAGLFFNNDHLVEWLEFFISVSMSRIQTHTVDDDLLESSLMGCRYKHDAYESYAYAHFPNEELICFASALYLKQYSLSDHPASRLLLFKFIMDEITSKRICREDIFQSLYTRLERHAFSHSPLHNAKPFYKNSSDNIGLLPDVVSALAELELSPENGIPDSESLQSHYRKLIKKYHPDLNPAGDAKSRRINSSYTFLIARITANFGM